MGKRRKKNKNKNRREGTIIYVNTSKEKEWETEGIEVHDNCPLLSGAKVYLTPELYAKIQEFNRAVGGKEWLGYLFGEWISENEVLLRDIYIPEQEVTSASVDVKDEDAKASIGVIHKHPWSGAKSFSSIDEEWINSNHDVSILIDADGKMTAVVRKLLPCSQVLGRKIYARTEASIEISAPNLEEIRRWVQENLKKVKEKTYTTYHGGYYPYHDWYGYYGRYYGKCPYMEAPEECPHKDYSSCSFVWAECPYQRSGGQEWNTEENIANPMIADEEFEVLTEDEVKKIEEYVRKHKSQQA